MIVRLDNTSYGWKAKPVNIRWQKRFEKAMVAMTGHADSRVIWAEEYELPSEITENQLYNRLLKKGWPMHIRVHSDLYAHWLGLDADLPY